MKEDKKKQVYPGWFVMIACVLLNALVFASLVSTPGLFTVPVTGELGFSRASFNIHISCCTFASMICNLFVGRIYAKVNPKWLVCLSTVVVGLSFFVKAGASQLWQFYLSSLLAGVGGAGTGLVVISILVNTWFGKKVRGKVMGIIQAGAAIGAAVMTSVLSGAISSSGWRAAYRLNGILVLVLAPIVCVCISKSPQDKGLEVFGADEAETAASAGGVELPGMDSKKAMRSAAFILAWIVFFLLSGIGFFYSTNIQPQLISAGYDLVKAGVYVSVGFLFTMAGRILLGVITDRWGVKLATILSILVLAAGCTLLAVTSFMPEIALAGMVLFCLGNNVGTVCAPLIILEHFGPKNYGTIFGAATFGTALGATAASPLGALVYDRAGSYLPAWIISIVLAVISLFLILGSYRACASMKKSQKS